MKRGSYLKPPLGTPLDNSHPSVQGLVGAWELNEKGGVLAHDATGKIGDGTFTNGPTWSTGAEGVEVKFAFGSTQYITIPYNATWNLKSSGTANCGPFTFMARVRLNTISAFNTIFTNQAAGGSVPFDSRVNGSGDVEIFLNSTYLAAPAAIAANRWYTVAVVYNDIDQLTGAGNARLYVNGVQADSSAVTAFIYPTNGYLVGVRADSFGPLDGSVSFVRLWNRAVTPAEIANLAVRPYEIFAVARKKVGKVVLANHTIVVPTGALVMTTYAPVVAKSEIWTPVAADAPDGWAPTV